jgi:molecular chaperone DnaK (HSP70)
MKRLPWTPWKFWNRTPVPSKRRIHLGIDYGTSVSKIVFRDKGAPGGETAAIVLRNGSLRIPSRVYVTATELFFGDDREDCNAGRQRLGHAASKATRYSRCSRDFISTTT